MKQREFIAFAGGAAAWPIAARAQQSAMPAIGFLRTGSPDATAWRQVDRMSLSIASAYCQMHRKNKALEKRIDLFRDELRLLGYEAGRNIEFHVRNPSSMANREVDQAVLANELVTLKSDVIFTFSSPASGSVHKATCTIPVVVGVSVERFVRNINRPEGNITGLSAQQEDVIGKQLQTWSCTASGSTAPSSAGPGRSHRHESHTGSNPIGGTASSTRMVE